MLTQSQLRISKWLRDAGVTSPAKRSTILPIMQENGIKWVPNFITHDPSRKSGKRGWYDIADLLVDPSVDERLEEALQETGDEMIAKSLAGPDVLDALDDIEAPEQNPNKLEVVPV